MKKQLLKKFYACLPVGMAFIVTAMMFSVSANAQIIYTDANPDVTTSQGTYNLDLNNDGTNDFVITHSSTTTFCPPMYGPNLSIRVTPLGTNQVVCISGTSATKMALNATINDTVLTWNNSANLLMAARVLNNACIGITNGQWINTADGYLGLKLISGSNIYYGWVRLNANGFVTSFTIKDYAYNSIPNQTILAGQTVATGIIENSFASSINLFPNPATTNLTITLASSSKKVDVSIIDITGKIIYKTTARETQKIDVNTEDFKEGIYIMQIQTAGFIVTKRLIVRK